MNRIAVLFTLPIAVLAAPVMADVRIYSTGQTAMATPTTSSPGTAFSLDYRSSLTAATAPYNLVEVLLSLDTSVMYSNVAITLGSSSTVYRFPQLAPGQTVYGLYDSTVMSRPPGDITYALLPAAWKTEAADGVISGHIWLEGAGSKPSYGILNMNDMFAVTTNPEPASLLFMTLGIGAFCLRRPRSFHQLTLRQQ